MVQSAKTDFVPSHLSTWVSFLLSEAVGGRRTFSEGGEVYIGGGRNTMGEIWAGGELGCLSKSEEGGCGLSGTKKPVLENSRN